MSDALRAKVEAIMRETLCAVSGPKSVPGQYVDGISVAAAAICALPELAARLGGTGNAATRQQIYDAVRSCIEDHGEWGVRLSPDGLERLWAMFDRQRREIDLHKRIVAAMEAERAEDEALVIRTHEREEAALARVAALEEENGRLTWRCSVDAIKQDGWAPPEEADALHARLAQAEARERAKDAALREVMALIDDHTLVRDISQDSEPGAFVKQSLRLVPVLKRAQDALDAPLPEGPERGEGPE